jgi:hypothetical protein
MSFSGDWIETGDFAFHVERSGPTITVHGSNGASFDLGLEELEDVVNGRFGLAGLIERCVYSSFPSSQQFFRLDCAGGR